MTSRALAIGHWLAGLRDQPPPRPVLEKMRDHLLDTIGAGIVGGGRDPVEIAERVYRAPGSVRLLIEAAPRSLIDAVRVNAVAAHAAEIDDTEGCDHSGAVVVPPLLGLFDDRGASSGANLLVAMTAGYEVGRRVQNALGGYDAHNQSGWHSTATCGVFASAAASAVLLGLDAEAIASALGIAASASSGGWAFASDGAMTKQLHAARAAAGGLESALLAEAGAQGPHGVFDDVWGSFFSTHGSRGANPGALLDDLGATWHAEHSAIKQYAACRSAHPALDAVVDALANGDLDPDHVESILIEVPAFLRPMICPDPVQTVEAARMSLPVSIALLLEGKLLGPDDYLAYTSMAVRNRLTGMTVRTNSRLTQARVVVTTRSGALTLERACARGSSPDALSSAAVRDKFVSLTGSRLTTESQGDLVRWVDGLGARPAVPLPLVSQPSGTARLPAAASR